MQALTNRAEQVSRKPMSFMERLYLPAIFKGMFITFKHIFTRNPTIHYPEQKRAFSPVFRGLQILNRDEEGRENCTACGLCAVACPAEAITMEAAERLPGEEHLYIATYLFRIRLRISLRGISFLRRVFFRLRSW